MALADEVRRLREDRYLSQAELADLAGVSRVTVARIEGGTIVPYPRTIRKLAEALGVPPQELISPAALAALKAAG
jgi:transcriptional regulator with XRE-family HTH domain